MHQTISKNESYLALRRFYKFYIKIFKIYFIKLSLIYLQNSMHVQEQVIYHNMIHYLQGYIDTCHSVDTCHSYTYFCESRDESWRTWFVWHLYDITLTCYYFHLYRFSLVSLYCNYSNTSYMSNRSKCSLWIFMYK
jgi:hypothetical protein